MVFAVACASFFSGSGAWANEREIERRTAHVIDRMLEDQARRSLELAEQLQHRQVDNVADRIIQSRVQRSVERNIENRIIEQTPLTIQDELPEAVQQQITNAEQQMTMMDVRLQQGQRRQIQSQQDAMVSRLTGDIYSGQVFSGESQRSGGRDDYEDFYEYDRFPEPEPEPEPDPIPEPDPEEEVPEDEMSDEDLLGSFDPSEDEDPSEKSNDQVEDEAAEEAEDQVSDAVEDQVGDDIVDDTPIEPETFFDVNDLQFEQVLTTVQNDARTLDNIDEKNVWTNQWVIMADPKAKQVLESEGYQFTNEEKLDAFDSIIANVEAPASFDLFEDYQQIMDSLDQHDAVIDLNHVYTNIYTSSTQSENDKHDGLVPGDIMHIDGNGVRIGMVDTAIDTKHKYLKNANIVQQHFTQDNRQPVFDHGTAVASVFSGASEDFKGIIDGAEIYNASVFIEADKSESITTALSLMKGLNWLVQQDIKVINMSLAGPPNRLLQKGIQQLCQQGIIVVAAAGNDGPFAKPMYPAGYGCALAVTAVDVKNNLYKKAVRGDHIDIAAYGVDIMAATDNNRLSAQSGTSIAAPFVTAWIAAQLPERGSARNWLDMALESCIDLGEEGIDPLYGKGLLPFDTVQLAKLEQFNHLHMLMHR